MPIDPNVFDKIKTFADYQRADQDFQLKRAAQLQAMQSSGIDAASKANVYATQVLSGAAAGGQDAYDQARQNLQAQGVDTSNYAPDVQTANQQLQQARLAQSPLGSLLNAGLKVDANNIAMAPLTGKMPVLNGINTALGGALPATQPVQSDGTSLSAPQAPALPPQPAGTQPAQGNASMSQADQSKALSDLFGAASASAPAQPVILSSAQSVASPTATSKFNPPAQRPDETLPAYNARIQQAFEAYKTDPTVQAAQEEAKAKAGALGKAQGEAEKAAVGAGANYDQVVQTIDGIKALNSSPAGLPQDRGFVPASAQAYLAQNIGDTSLGNAIGAPTQAVADNANAFTKLNEAQTIGAIKELASTGQIRMTRTLENILNRGYLIDPGASPTSKNQQADLILAELNNSKIAAQNVNAGMNGGQAAPYQAMPVAQPANASSTASVSAPPPGATLYGTSGGKKVYKMPDGSFLMEQ